MQLDVRLEVAMVACHDGIETIYLPDCDNWPGKDFQTSGIPRKWVSFLETGPGRVLAMAPTNNSSVIVTRSTETKDMGSVDNTAPPLDPSWSTLKQLGWSPGLGAQCFVGMPSELQIINPITHTDRE